MNFADLDRLGSENEVKAEGLYLQKGKDYEVADGDIIYFKFNVTAQPKKVDTTTVKKWEDTPKSEESMFKVYEDFI